MLWYDEDFWNSLSYYFSCCFHCGFCRWSGSKEDIFPAAECNLEDLEDDELNFETDKLLLEINEALDEDTFQPSSVPSDNVSTSSIDKLASDVPTTMNKGAPGIDVIATENSVITDSPAVNLRLLRTATQNNNSVKQEKSQNNETLSTSIETLPVDDFGFPLSIFKKV